MNITQKYFKTKHKFKDLIIDIKAFKKLRQQNQSKSL